MGCSVKRPHEPYEQGVEKVRTAQVSRVGFVDEHIPDTAIHIEVRFQLVPRAYVPKVRLSEEVHVNVVVVGYQQAGK